jgi:uncharacterized protein (DUF2236 family)
MRFLDPFGALRWFRERVAVTIRDTMTDDATRSRETRPCAHDDTGLFGPDSVTWRIHQDSSMLVGGLRALFLQTMHPLAMAGVADHSNYREDSMGRLARTSAYVGITTFGTHAEAVAAVGHVRRVHERVVGVAADGRPYAANDPHLLTWVHHTLVDSFLRAYRRYGARPLSRPDADRYVEEMAVMTELWEAEPGARSVDELRDWFAEIRPELHATTAARRTARWLALAPVPLPARAPYAVIAPAAVGLLPSFVRRELRVPMLPAFEPLVVRPAAFTLVRTLDWFMAALPVDDAATVDDATADDATAA